MNLDLVGSQRLAEVLASILNYVYLYDDETDRGVEGRSFGNPTKCLVYAVKYDCPRPPIDSYTKLSWSTFFSLPGAKVAHLTVT